MNLSTSAMVAAKVESAVIEFEIFVKFVYYLSSKSCFE